MMKEKEYKRDKRSPIPSSDIASKVMSSIKGKDTKPELLFRKLLWQNGLRGYRLHYRIPGKPDIVFVSKKIAIFLHGCYWHRCPKCDLPIPRSNSEFWKNKFQRNVERDKSKELLLKKEGWKVIVVWECEIENESAKVIKKIKRNFDC